MGSPLNHDPGEALHVFKSADPEPVMGRCEAVNSVMAETGTAT
ncbi:hypothetical protein M877_06640 [Streptomyces niveus NCIMB 11891]|nr:hypothetical protein M877_06640 [Streptomyces niveus NCIMB 11891]